MTSNEIKETEKVIQQAMDMLGRAGLECVQILASTQHSGHTHSFFYGKGNWFARTGMAHAFLDEDKANVTISAIAEEGNGDDDEQDDTN